MDQEVEENVTDWMMVELLCHMDQEVEENVTDWMIVGRVTAHGSGGRGECYRLDDGR